MESSAGAGGMVGGGVWEVWEAEDAVQLHVS